MAAPRTTIPELPEQTVATDTDELVVQNGPTTKRMTVGRLTTHSTQALNDHINALSGAHQASAISAVPAGPPFTGDNVQIQLSQGADSINQLLALINGHIAVATDAHNASAISVIPVGNLAAVDVQAALVELQTSLDAVPVDSVSAEGAVDAVAAALFAGNNIDITYNDVANTITIDVEGLTKADVGLDNVDNTSDLSKPVSVATQTALNAKVDAEGAVDATAAAFAAGTHTNVTVTYNDAANSISLAASGGTGGGITTEDAVDSVAAALVAGNNIDVTYNDAANTITVDVEPLTSADVGLGNVNNTSDASKPVSAAQQTALDLKADKTITIATTAPLTGGGTLAANRTLDISTFTASVKGAVPPPTTATGKYLKDDGTWGTPAGGGASAQTIEAVAGTTYTVVTADANKIKSMSGTATVTLPSAGPAVGERVDFVCVGGPATFALGGGATWAVAPTPSAVARAVGSFVTAIKMGATTWALTGDLSG